MTKYTWHRYKASLQMVFFNVSGMRYEFPKFQTQREDEKAQIRAMLSILRKTTINDKSTNYV